MASLYQSTDKEILKYQFLKETLYSSKQSKIFISADRKYILKIFKNQNLFLKELKFLTHLSHPSIIKPVTFTENRKIIYPFYDEIYSCISSDDKLFSIFKDILSAISYLHSKRIAYLNFSTEHLRYDKVNKRAVLINFTHVRECYESKDSTLIIPGNPNNPSIYPLGYSDPEHVCYENNDISSELYSVCILGYYLYRGYPFTLSEYESCTRHFEYDPFCTFVKEDNDFVTKIKKCLIFKENMSDIFQEFNVEKLPSSIKKRRKSVEMNQEEYNSFLKFSREIIKTSIDENWNIDVIFRTLHLFRTEYDNNFSVFENINIFCFLSFLCENKSYFIMKTPSFENILYFLNKGYSNYSFSETVFEQKDYEQLLTYYLDPEFDERWNISNFYETKIPTFKEPFLRYSSKIEEICFSESFTRPDLIFETPFNFIIGTMPSKDDILLNEKNVSLILKHRNLFSLSELKILLKEFPAIFIELSKRR